MTHWLTDRPDTTQCFLPNGVKWSPCPREPKNHVQSAIIKSFNDDKPAWVAETPDTSSRYPERYFVLIDQAAESQFDRALDELQLPHDLPDGIVCIALTGSGFRGQRKRPWQAVRGNLHLTAHYVLGISARENQAALTMLPAVASAEAIDELKLTDTKPAIKWVNDVLLKGKKVSGVLTATHISGENIERVIFGIGVNVEKAPKIDATPFVPEAGAITEGMDNTDAILPSLFFGIVNKMDELVLCLREGRQDEIFRRYTAKAGFVGHNVCVWPEGTEDWQHTEPIAQGRVMGLNEDLSLNIEGLTEPVRSGRLAYEENC